MVESEQEDRINQFKTALEAWFKQNFKTKLDVFNGQNGNPEQFIENELAENADLKQVLNPYLDIPFQLVFQCPIKNSQYAINISNGPMKTMILKYFATGSH